MLKHILFLPMKIDTCCRLCIDYFSTTGAFEFIFTGMQHGDDLDQGDAARPGRGGRGRGARGGGRGGRGGGRGRGRGARGGGRGGRGRGGGDANNGGGRGRRGRQPAQRRARGRQAARVWTAPGDFQPQIPAFTGNAGIQVDVENFSPFQFFSLYVDDDLINHFVHQTNKYAREFIATAQLAACSRARAWTETNPAEMRIFLGIVFLMGIVKKPDLNSYWSTDPLIRTPAFPAAMPRDRFILLLKFWHMNDNDNLPAANEPNRDRLFKLRPVLDHLFQKFQEVFTPGRDIAIDESLLLWKGRLVFKQYIPLKRARFGIKSFLLCDSTGYTYRFRVYAGRDESTAAIDAALPPEAANLGRTGKEVVHLMLPLLNKGHRLFTRQLVLVCRLV